MKKRKKEKRKRKRRWNEINESIGEWKKGRMDGRKEERKDSNVLINLS